MEEWLDKLNKEAISICHHLDLFKKLGEIIDKNQKIKEMDNTLVGWMRRAFITDLIIAIGRICDKDTRTGSLVNFLQELKDKKDYLTRERFVQLYPEDDRWDGIANADFDNLAGTGEQIFPPRIILEDILRITEEEPFKKILLYRHQYIAHSDKGREEISITFAELYQAFDIIEEIVKKYNLLLRSSQFVKLAPEMQGYWEEVLTIPWIEQVS
jgi:hypothetical protein